MKKLFTLIFSCVLAICANSQFEYFNSVFSIEQNNDAVATNIEVVGNGYFVLGQYISSDGLPELSLLSMNSEGVQLGTTTGSYGYYELTNLADAFISTSDGNFLWGGSYTELDGFHAVLSKFNADFEIGWTYDYWNSEEAEFHGCTEISDGYLGYGVVTINENNDINADYGDLLITKLNVDGTLLWQQIIPVFDQEYFLRITKAFELPNGDFMVFGSRYYDWDYFAIKLDSLGNYIDGYTWGTPLFDWIPWPIDLGNGEFMVAWQESHYYYQEDETGTPVSTPHLKKFDANSMAEVWDVEYETDSLYVGYMGDIVQTEDGGFMLLGNTDHPMTEDDFVRSGFIIKTDSLGQKQWNKYYDHLEEVGPFNDFSELWDIELTNDGGFLAGGTFDQNSMGLQQIWVIKGDCMGNLELPPISFTPALQQLNDSTFYLTITGENLYDFQWDLGNGDVEELDTITYIFDELGEYTITASGRYCALTLDSTFAVIVPDCMGNPDTPDLVIGGSYEQNNQFDYSFECTFQNLENIHWDFEDGNTADGPSVEHTFAETGFYDVVVCGNYCDSVLCDTLEVSVQIGIDEAWFETQLYLSPNPTNYSIQLQSSQIIHDISITDLSGRQVFAQLIMSGNKKVDLSGLSSGVYLLQATYLDGRVEVVRMVKE